MDFSELKKRTGQDSIRQLTEQLDAANKWKDRKKSFEDDRMWDITLNADFNGTAVLRFLDAPPGETVPYATIQHYAFQGPSGLYYIENCLNTIGQKDPCQQYIKSLWDSKLQANIQMIKDKKMKKQNRYISNVYVIKDPGNPENEGKVFLFKYGPQIFQFFHDKMYPNNEGLEPGDEGYKLPINPYHMWEGLNFRLVARKDDGFVHYKASEFTSSTPKPLLEGDDQKIHEVWQKEYPLLPFLDPSAFKTYDQLKERLDKVLGNAPAAQTKQESKPKVAPKVNSLETEDSDVILSSEDSDADGELDEFLKSITD